MIGQRLSIFFILFFMGVTLARAWRLLKKVGIIFRVVFLGRDSKIIFSEILVHVVKQI